MECYSYLYNIVVSLKVIKLFPEHSGITNLMTKDIVALQLN